MNFLGSFKNCTNSTISSFSSSSPATSSNFTFVFLSVSSYTSPLSPNPCILNIIINNATIIIVGSSEKKYDGIVASMLGLFWISSISFPSATLFCINSTKLCVLGTMAFFINSGSSSSFFIKPNIELV